MAAPRANHQNEAHPLDSAEQLLAEVEALNDDFGPEAVAAAVKKTRASEYLDRKGSISALRVAQTLLHEIGRAKNSRLQADVMMVATGIYFGAETMGRIAAKYGMTKQAFSKRVIAYCDANGLPPSPGMRSKKDRETYRLTNQPRSS